VPALLCQFLRPHQRSGVQFVYDSVTGRRHGGYGCILADDMGLGKTLVTIAALYTLLQLGEVEGAPFKRAVVVCPCSLVGNWTAEFEKWVNSRASTRKQRIEVKAVLETREADNVIGAFLSPQRPAHVLVISYDTFRGKVDLFKGPCACDVLVADEAQRLKGAATQLYEAFGGLPCRRRILLTGTPLQNDLDEFHALSNAANPGLLGSASDFSKKFSSPISAARDRGASELALKAGAAAQAALSVRAVEFMLRRENKINAIHLPPKLVQVVCCAPAAAQIAAYRAIVDDKHLRHALEGKQKDVLGVLGKLQKLCNHPALLLADAKPPDEAASAKMHVLKRLMHEPLVGGIALFRRRLLDVGLRCTPCRRLRRRDEGPGGNERIVVVANATSVLTLIGALCDRQGWPWVMLDGKTPAKRRTEIAAELNDPKSHFFALLLSSTAGGAGLNLIGASRLVLFDSAWNPAVDRQAAARCWRDGQTRRCFTYRLLTTGTVEEKIFQRQLAKDGLNGVLDDKDAVNAFDTTELRRLFSLTATATSDTHEQLRCDCC
ncbi:P-loop containing nucleoside triphosphate hydrolase protein, partial [Pelagophyceae sp. CCMP2097]